MIKYMKKIFLLLMILTVSFSLVSCNENESSNGKTDIEEPTTETVSTPT